MQIPEDRMMIVHGITYYVDEIAAVVDLVFFSLRLTLYLSFQLQLFYRMTKALSFLTIFAVVCTRLYSQTISASPYSVYGIGMINGKSSALNRSMGGTGIGVRDPNNLNNYNPAAYTSIQGSTQMFELGFYIESDYYQTTKQSDKFYTGGLTGVNAWFRFSKRWAGVMGLSPFSRINYNVSSTRKIGSEEGSGVSYSGTGGFSQFYFGNSFQVTRNLSVGVDGSYLFGSINKNEFITSGYGSGTVLKNSVSANRLKTDLGIQYSFFLDKKRSVNFGFTYGHKVRLNTKSEMMLIGSQGDTTASDEADIEDYVLPSALGAGISYQSRRSTVAIDLKYTKWSEATLEDHIGLRNTSRLSFGYTYEGNPNGLTYFDFVQLKTGFYIGNNYLLLADASFDEWGLSAGVELPIAGNRGTINISYHYNRSGTLQGGMVREQANMLMVDLTFRDVWGIRRKFD
jgi:hypothetical protein